jgi:hypothetical protein
MGYHLCIPLAPHRRQREEDVVKTMKSYGYLLLNTNGTRIGLETIRKSLRNSNDVHITYVVLKLWRNAVTRA